MSKKKGNKIRVEEPTDEVLEHPDAPADTVAEAVDQADGQTASPDDAQTLTDRVASLEDALLRAKAETQNVQRRAANEKSQAIRFAHAELMKSLLPVLDDFDRSLEAAREADHDVEGIRLVHDNLFRALASHGLSRIEAAGEPFDPMIHEAMLQQPSADHADGTVLEELAKGYKLHERVLRPTRVIVSKAIADQTTADAKEE